MDAKTLRANLILVLTAVIWGAGFVAQRLGMQDMGPFTFNALRFALGAGALLPLLFWRRKEGQPALIFSRTELAVGGTAGLFLFFGATFQQLGLVYTTAGKAGFITGLYIIIVPLLGMLWGDRAEIQSWLGAGLAVAGLYLLSVRGGTQFALGDSYVLVGAFFWAGHVQFIAHFSSRMRPVRLSFIQSLVTALVSLGVGLAFEDTNLSMIREAAGPILYGGVISIGIAYTLQVVAQQDARPTHAAIILSLEAVFAVFWGWLLLGENLDERGLMGAGLMLAGMLVSQLGVRPGTQGDGGNGQALS